MVLGEQVRSLSDESSKIDDSTIYLRNIASWGTIHDYGNIVLTENSLLVLKFTMSGAYASEYRLKVGGVSIWAGHIGATGNLLIYVAAGTVNILMENYGNGQINSMKVGIAKFTDQVSSLLATYSSTINLTVANRETCIGALKNAVFAVQCFASTPGGQTNFENVGDTLTNGVSLAVDGVQVDWTARTQDTGSYEAASAYYYGSLSVGSAHSFAITKDNANTVVKITIIATPWILAAIDNEPVTLNFAQMGTFYVMLEPLVSDPTKNSKIGKKRAVSFGDSTDYYSIATPAAGIMTHSYTFEIIDVTSQFWVVSGLFGCVSHIAVDER